MWDSGRGIPKDKHREIFQEFRQLDNPQRDRRKGLGLGLAIVRSIMDLHEGRASAENGDGFVRFSLFFPAVAG